MQRIEWAAVNSKETELRDPLVLTTAIPGVVLRELTTADTEAWIDHVLRNSAHLSKFGDDTLPPHTVEDVNRWLSGPREQDLKMGIWKDDVLMGSIEISHLSLATGGERLLTESPNGWALGYGIGSEYTGKGYVTESCRTLMEYARSELGAKEFFSGARHGNVASMAVLERLGFSLYKKDSASVGYRLKASGQE